MANEENQLVGLNEGGEDRVTAGVLGGEAAHLTWVLERPTRKKGRTLCSHLQ